MTRQLSEPIEGIATEEESEAFTRLEEAVEADLAREDQVNIRWLAASLDIVRQAAAVAGVPYQTYVKQVAFRQALTDLKDAREAGVSAQSK